MMKLFVLLAVVAVASAAPAPKLANCDAGKTQGTFSKLVITPPMPAKGDLITFNATGTTTAAVSTATYDIDVKFSGIDLYTHSGNVCGQSTLELPLNVGKVAIDGLACPLTATDPLVFSLAVDLPKSVPSGAYDIQFKGTQTSGEIFCIEATFTL